MENELPSNWSSVRLEEVVIYRKGKKPKRLAKEPFDNSVPYLDIHAIEKKEIRQWAEILSSLLTNEYELVVVWDGARSDWIGKGQTGAVGSTLMALRPIIVNHEYLYRFIQSQFDYLNTNTKGTGIPHVNPEILWNIQFPVAPLNEQNRIGDKLDKLFAKLNSVQERIVKIPRIIPQFRQAVLQTAVRAGDIETTTNEVCEQIQIGPFGTQLHKHDYISNGIPIVNPTHIQGGKVVPNDDFTISKRKYNELSNYYLKKGDVIMGRRGEMARCALINDKEHGWLCGTGSLFFRPNQERVNPQYLYWLLSSSDTKEFLESQAKGTTMSNLNLRIVKQIPLTLPSIKEQQEIVRKMEQLFEYTNQLEAHYLKAKAFIENFPQSILSKAFTGQLVPQDPDDEPAEVLLERIREEKENLKKAGNPKKQKEVV